jgi:ribosomal protein L11 methyltransferase
VAADVIDVGCGSGVLSIAALKLGARRTLGVDVDEDALRAARQNAELNGVADCLELGLGSVAEVKAGAFSLRQASLVLANILASVLIRLLDEGLGKLVTPRGVLVLSGMLEEQVRDVENALQEHDLSPIGRRQEGDWVALWATKTIARQ